MAVASPGSDTKSISCEFCKEETEADTKPAAAETVKKLAKKKPREKWIVDLCKELAYEKTSKKSYIAEAGSQLPQTHKPSLDTLKCVPTEEEKYMEVFQASIADGLALKECIKTSLISIDGVEAVSVGFSTKKKEGHWPVIRIYPNQETCKKIKVLGEEKKFVKGLCVAVKKVLTDEPIKQFSDECSDEEFATLIEVVNDSFKAPLKFCSAGAAIKTRYNSHDRETHTNTQWTESGTAACCVKSTISIGDEHHVAHWLISAFHPVVPSCNHEFPRLSYAHIDDNGYELKHELTSIDYIPHNCCETKGNEDKDPYKMPCLLYASLFPQTTKEAFQKMTDRYQYQSVVRRADFSHGHIVLPQLPPVETIKFLCGKAGLIKKHATMDNPVAYTQVLLANAATGNIPFFSHPCNVDIALFKRTRSITQYCCSIEECMMMPRCCCRLHPIRRRVQRNLHPPIMRWVPDGFECCGPPGDNRLADWAGQVVIIKQGKIHKVSDQMIEFNTNNEYPICVWEPGTVEQGCKEIDEGDSGAPVFIKKKNKFHLIGILISKVHASPIDFSLQVIRADIALHHCQQVLDENEVHQEDHITKVTRLMEFFEVIQEDQFLIKLPIEVNVPVTTSVKKNIKFDLEICYD